MAKILLVDDDLVLLEMYQTKFKNRGYEIDVAQDGESGLTKIRQSRPDCILLDIMMPKVDGLGVLKKIKADDSIKTIPVILLTNVGSSEEDIEKGLQLGAVAYLIKTNYTPAEVVAKVEEILKGYLHQPTEAIPDVKVTVKNTLRREN